MSEKGRERERLREREKNSSSRIDRLKSVLLIRVMAVLWGEQQNR